MTTDAKTPTAKSPKKSLAWQNDPQAGAIEYEEVESGDFFKFTEKTPTIEGQLLHVGQITFRSSDGKDKPVGSYKILTPDGEEKKFNGAVTLDEKMREIPINTMVRITYIGTERTGGNRQLRQFKVERQKS